MGSTPIEDFVRVAKWISRPTSNREIAGSIPASDIIKGGVAPYIKLIIF